MTVSYTHLDVYKRQPLGLLATGDAWGEWDAEGAATAVQEVGDDSLQASVGLDTCLLYTSF